MAEDINKSVFLLLEQPFSNLILDVECSDYSGCSFLLGSHTIKFRNAKVTPKKEGAFTALWKRDSEGKTVPFEEKDLFDFYIIMATQNSKTGYFIFPSHILAEHGILSTEDSTGKRGFRLYPPWSCPDNKQALKTQAWQLCYFIEKSGVTGFEKIIQKQEK